MSTNLLDIYWLRMVLNYLIIILAFALMGLVVHKLLQFSLKQTLIGLGIIAILFFTAQVFGLVHISIL